MSCSAIHSILRQLNNASVAAVAKFQNSISRSWSLSNNLTGYLSADVCPAATVAGNNAALPICAAREGTVRKREEEEETASKVDTVFGEMSDDSIINNCERRPPSCIQFCLSHLFLPPFYTPVIMMGSPKLSLLGLICSCTVFENDVIHCLH